MSMDAMRAWEEHSRAAGTPYVVGKQLAIWAERGTALCWAENPKIAKAVRLSVRQVQRALRSLELSHEIIRQAPQPGRRRVYLIDPQGAGQLPLFAPRGDTRVTFDAPDVMVVSAGNHDTTVADHDTHARTGKEGHEGLTTTPPLPPQQVGGGSQAFTILLGKRQQAVTVSPSGHMPRRQRRRAPTIPPPAPCPVPTIDEPDQARLAEAWAQLHDQLAQHVPDSVLEVWFAGAHLHHLEPVTIAVDPHRLRWIASRFAIAIPEVVGSDVQLTACDQHAGVLS